MAGRLHSSMMQASTVGHLLVKDTGDSDNNEIFNCLQSWHNYSRMLAHMWAGNFLAWDIYLDFYDNTKRMNKVTCVEFPAYYNSMTPGCQFRVAAYFSEIFALSGPILIWRFGTVRDKLRATISDAHNISISCMPTKIDRISLDQTAFLDIKSMMD